MTLKRKRGRGEARFDKDMNWLFKAKARPLKRSRTFRAGVDRTGGFYGRYSGSRGGELKFHDVSLDDLVVSNTGTITNSVNLIGQGVTESERVGRKCTIKSFNWKYIVSIPTQDAVATPFPSEVFRIILFIDKQCNGATAVVLDILETAVLTSFRNLANTQRFVILYDKIHNVQQQTLASDGAGVVSSSAIQYMYNVYRKLNLPIEFSSTTGAITEIRSNNIGVLLISANNVGKFDSEVRLRFSDY